MRLAYFVSHPIQYQAPLLRLLAQEPDLDLKVFFFSDFSVRGYQDPDFGMKVTWDVPLTEGYDHQFLQCWGSKQWYSWWQQPIATDIDRVLAEGKFDAIWVHGWFWFCSLQVISAAHRLGIPILLRGEANGLTEPTNPLKASLKDKFIEWLFPKISAFLYVGSNNRQFYERRGIDSKRLFSVPYAVDNDFFQQRVAQARSQRDELKQSLGLDARRPIILFAAKLTDVKRPQDLLAAYKLLSPDGKSEPEPYLLFVGDGILKPELEAQAQATGWNSIKFLGFRNQSQMPMMYDLCDVFVLPSRFEPWGLAINEVMNAGKAVVVSDAVGCAVDLIGDGDNGRIVGVGDIVQLKDALSWAIDRAATAGANSLTRIHTWSFREDIAGIKAALQSL